MSVWGEKKKRETFWECAWQLILNNREKLIRQKWNSSVSVLLLFQLDDVLRGSMDEENVTGEYSVTDDKTDQHFEISAQITLRLQRKKKNKEHNKKPEEKDIAEEPRHTVTLIFRLKIAQTLNNQICSKRKFVPVGTIPSNQKSFLFFSVWSCCQFTFVGEEKEEF